MATTRKGTSDSTSTKTRTTTRASKSGTGSASKSSTRARGSTGAAAGSGTGRFSGGGAGNVVIVESPAKAKTIKKYLGAGFTVQASMGHVRDLPKDDMGVDIQGGFEPKYVVPRDKSRTVKELQALVRGASTVYLATDPDREGEAIAWHIREVTGAGRGGQRVYRVEFHEITPGAIQGAIANPRDLDMQRVDAQQARRVLDRLVGYRISPVLWKKVRRGLSAGRVQSVAVRLVVEREREIEAFVPVEYWTVEADLSKRPKGDKRNAFHAQLSAVNGKKAELHNGDEAGQVVDGLRGAAYVVEKVQTKEVQRRPSAPFITSTLQQEASRKLGYGAKRTMQIAQQLYEGVDVGSEGSVGLITYMRTDSTNVASVAQQEARRVISERYGPQFLPHNPPVYSKKVAGAQEAHEAIRPTSSGRDPEAVRTHVSPEQYRLYRLIWQRFVASQMANAIFDQTSVDIGAGKQEGPAPRPYTFRATGSVVKFPGFLSVYREGRDDDAQDEIDKEALPPLVQGEGVDLLKLWPEQHFTQPPARYTEATLVKALEEKGIGRPSTYASILSTIQDREYVEIREKKLYPTPLGAAVNDLLVQSFPDIVDVGFTSSMEGKLDEIAEGHAQWVPVVAAFYGPLDAAVTRAEQSGGRVQIAREARPEPEKTGEMCPDCGKELLLREGRFGKFLACSGYPKCKYTREADGSKRSTGVKCPQCGQGEIVEKRTRKGKTFWSCDRYPKCEYATWDKPGTGTSTNGADGKEQVRSARGTHRSTGTSHATPARTSGTRGSTRGSAPGAPAATAVAEPPGGAPTATLIACPECGQGQVVEKLTRKGKTFWSCNRFPKCRYATWDSPYK